MKTCTVCHIEKDILSFSKEHSRCKECRNKILKEKRKSQKSTHKTCFKCHTKKPPDTFKTKAICFDCFEKNTLETHKICRKCNISLPLSTFHKAGRLNAYRGTCKECEKNKTNNKISVRESSELKNIEEEKAYVLGLLYTESKDIIDRLKVKIHVMYDDMNIIRDIREEISNTKRLFVNHHKKSEYDTLTISNKERTSIDNLKQIIPYESQYLSYNEYVKNEFVSSFVKGYFDGSGCLTAVFAKYPDYFHWEISIHGTSVFIQNFKNAIQSYLEKSQPLYINNLTHLLSNHDILS